MRPEDFSSQYDEHGGDLPMVNDRGQKSIPGIGCPSCPAGFYTWDRRTAHIQTMHPGESAAPTRDVLNLVAVNPDLAHHFGLGGDRNAPAASWVPNDLSALGGSPEATPRPSRAVSGKGQDIRQLQSHIKSVHAQILQHVGLGDRDIQRLDKAVRGAHQHLNYAHEADAANKPVEYRNHIEFAHTHIDDMHDINEDAWGDREHTEALQEHIGRLYH